MYLRILFQSICAIIRHPFTGLISGDDYGARDSKNKKKLDLIKAKLPTDKGVIIVKDLNECLDSELFAKLNENNTFYFCTSELSCDSAT